MPWSPPSTRRTCARSSCNPAPFPRRLRAPTSASCWQTNSRAGAAWCARRTSERIDRLVAGAERTMNKTLALLAGLIVTTTATSGETLKVAVAQPGFWNSTFIDVGLKQGYFREAGLDIEILYTEGGASTLTPVIAGSIDIAMTNGMLGVIAGYATGMPVKIISAEATGAAEAFWYARPESGITRLADTNGKTVAFSSPGSSTNLILLQLVQQAKVAPKLVATGGAPGTLTQVMSGQIDVGWSVPPFVLQQLADGKLAIIAKGSDPPQSPTRPSASMSPMPTP